MSGSYSPSHSKTVTSYSGPNYNQDGYVGTLKYEPEVSYVTYQIPAGASYTTSANGSCSGSYDGLSLSGSSVSGNTMTCEYSGYKPGATVREEKDAWVGTATKPAIDTRKYEHYYQYDITIDYDIIAIRDYEKSSFFIKVNNYWKN